MLYIAAHNKHVETGQLIKILDYYLYHGYTCDVVVIRCHKGLFSFV